MKENTGVDYWLKPDYNPFEETIVDGEKVTNINYAKLAATTRSMSKFVNILTGQRIPIYFQNHDRSYTDGRHIVIGTEFYKRDLNSIIGDVLHEGSHIAFTDFSITGKEASLFQGGDFHKKIILHGHDPQMSMTVKELKRVHSLWNFVEDRRLDMKIYTLAPGYRIYYDAMYNECWNSSKIDDALINKKFIQESWRCYQFHVINLTNKHRDLTSLSAMEKIWNTLDLGNIQRLQNSEDALEVALDIYELIVEAVQDAKSEEEMSMSGQDNEPNRTPSWLTDDMIKEMGGSLDDSALAEESEKEDRSSQINSTINFDSDDLPDDLPEGLKNDIQAQLNFLSGEKEKEGALTMSEASLVTALAEAGVETRQVNSKVNDPDSLKIETTVIKSISPELLCNLHSTFDSALADWKFNKPLLSKHDNQSFQKSYDGRMDIVKKGLSLGRRLGTAIQMRNEERKLKSTRQKNGKIDKRLIAEIGFGNKRIFEHTSINVYKNLFIHISIDASSSMSGVKFDNALISAIAVAKAASMTSGIRVQISLRGTDSSITTVYVYDSAKNNIRSIQKYFPFLRVFGSTPEGIAFESIYNDIRSDSMGDECFFINYSDGYPNGPVEDPIEYTRQVVNKMKSLGIRVLSYYINSYNMVNTGQADPDFCRMYGNGAQFIDPTNLGQVAKSMNQKFMELRDVDLAF